MSDERAPGTIPAPTPATTGWRFYFRTGENLLMALALGALMVLPLAEIFLRAVFRTGISGSSAFVQHFTLIVGMLGGAIAAREGRLLSLSTLTTFLKGRVKAGADIFANAFAAAISVLLCQASWGFLLTEKEGGKTLAYDLPIWVVQLILPIGFGLVALRLLWRAADGWKGRVLSALLTAGLLWAGASSPLGAESMVVPSLVALLVATLFGAPIFTIIGGVTLILLTHDQAPIEAIPLKHYSLVTNPTLPTIPLFTLAGYFLAEGGASKRLVRVFAALVGQFRGGPVAVTVLVCAFFTSFTGASGVTILALGGLLMPVLLAAGYSERTSLGLLTGAGSLGVLFPPCLPLILYAIIASTVAANLDVGNVGTAGVSIEQMFLGGVIPGTLMVILTVGLGIWQGPKERLARRLFDPKEARQAVWQAKWELLLPVVALGALFSGYATPVEASAVTALYALVIETFVYRDLKLIHDVPRVMTECGLLVGGVLLILGVSMGFTNPRGGMGQGSDSFSVAFSTRPESVPPGGRLPDGHLFRDRGRGPPHCSNGPGLWHRPDPPRHRVPGQPATGVLDAAGGHEPVPGLVSLWQTDRRNHSGGLSHLPCPTGRRVAHHLHPAPDHLPPAPVEIARRASRHSAQHQHDAA
jgi:tripartite ATP-independent transporter DctM subunit